MDARAVALLDRVLPYLGPGLAFVLGLVALGHRSLDIDEAATVAPRAGRSRTSSTARSPTTSAGGVHGAPPPRRRVERRRALGAAPVGRRRRRRRDRRLPPRAPPGGKACGAAASLLLASSLGVVLLSRTVGPLALALAAMLLSSALFARAVERGNASWWAVYAVSAALLPLTHPIAASALVAQIAALVVARREVELRLAVPAVAIATWSPSSSSRLP